MAAEEPEWRTELLQRMQELQEDVGDFVTALDGSRARLEALRLSGTDGPITTGEGSRQDIDATYTDLTARLQAIAGIVASMRHVEQRALIEASDDPALPLVSVADFHDRDLIVWWALLRLQGGRRMLANTARGLVDAARVAVAAAGHVLVSRPRPYNVRTRIASNHQSAVDSLREACALAVGCRVRLDEAVAAIEPPLPMVHGDDDEIDELLNFIDNLPVPEGDDDEPAVVPVEGAAAQPAVVPVVHGDDDDINELLNIIDNLPEGDDDEPVVVPVEGAAAQPAVVPVVHGDDDDDEEPADVPVEGAAAQPAVVPVVHGDDDDDDDDEPADVPVEGAVDLPPIGPLELELFALADLDRNPNPDDYLLYGDLADLFVFDENGVVVPPPGWDDDDDGVAVPPPDQHQHGVAVPPPDQHGVAVPPPGEDDDGVAVPPPDQH
jgi:hypothetical protein